MTTEGFAAGETVILRESFTPNILLFWLKTNLTVTEKRIAGRVPNTFLGLIPTGAHDVLFPLKQVSGLSVNSNVKPIRIIVGLVVSLAGVASLGANPVVGIIVALLGIVLVLGGLTCSLAVTNNAGAQQFIPVMLFQKAQLQSFASRASQHLLDL